MPRLDPYDRGLRDGKPLEKFSTRLLMIAMAHDGKVRFRCLGDEWVWDLSKVLRGKPRHRP